MCRVTCQGGGAAGPRVSPGAVLGASPVPAAAFGAPPPLRPWAAPSEIGGLLPLSASSEALRRFLGSQGAHLLLVATVV